MNTPAKPALPGPDGYFYEVDSYFGIHRQFDLKPYNGMRPQRTISYYSADTVRAAIDAAVAEARAVPEEFCWLVELFEGDGTGNSAGWYHTGFVDIGGHSRTTKSPYEARRYASRDQAERVAAKLGHTLTGTWKAVEHGFSTTPSPTEPAMLAERVALSEETIDALRDLDTVRRVRFYEHDFYVLSNFSAFSILWEGRRFDTSEHLYHYLKFNTTALDVADAIYDARSAHEAFKLAERNKGSRRKDWDSVKVDLMRDILRLKAGQHEYVRRKLLATGDRELVEDSWRDDFWGWGPNRDGQNMLGKLWMEVRAELRGILPAQGKGEQG